MNYLDLYLQKNNCKRYDVYKKTGVSQQLLSTHAKKKVEKYSNKVIIALAETLDKTPGTVLDELILLEKENPNFEAYNPEDLLIGLNGKYDVIEVKGIYCREVYNIMKTHLSENESMGADLATGGMASLASYAFIKVWNLFSKAEKIDKDIEEKLLKYKVKELTEERLVLTLKQLEY